MQDFRCRCFALLAAAAAAVVAFCTAFVKQFPAMQRQQQQHKEKRNISIRQRNQMERNQKN